VSWQVRTRAEAGWSDWSAAHEFETGLLDAADWHGRFISSPGPVPPGGPLYLRRLFTVTGPPARARVYAVAHGCYELHLDGTRISDPGLILGPAARRPHRAVRAYDITSRCQPGKHELIATVTRGSRRDAARTGHIDQLDGGSLALLAQVEIADQAGGRWDIATGAGWQATTGGPVSGADLAEGQQALFPPTAGWRDAVVLGTSIKPHPREEAR
jgi:alpha-L-rhamnosidase